jgi:hypothetical protein
MGRGEQCSRTIKGKKTAQNHGLQLLIYASARPRHFRLLGEIDFQGTGTGRQGQATDNGSPDSSTETLTWIFQLILDSVSERAKHTAVG